VSGYALRITGSQAAGGGLTKVFQCTLTGRVHAGQGRSVSVVATTDGEREALTAVLRTRCSPVAMQCASGSATVSFALSSAEFQRGLRRTELVGGLSVQRSLLNHVEARGPVYP